jgi:hypothetical protein
MPASASAKRRALAPLRHLPRSVALNYLRQALEPCPGRPARSPGAALLAALGSYARRRLGPRHALPDYGAGEADRGIHRLGDEDAETRVAIAGDWGSGTDEAAAVARAMIAANPHFTIHLGDVYYVGEECEVRSSMLGEPTCRYEPTRWPRGSVGTFALNGNHEMYARGTAYFDVLLPALGLSAGPAQRTSFFCLENAHWRLLALDTAYHSVGWPLFEELPFAPFAPSNALGAAQLRWLAGVVRPAADARGLVILTHHSPYGPRGHGLSRAAQQLQQLIRRPVLWFCGHEHRLAVYGRLEGGAGLTVWGRKVGHGGMPVEPPARVAGAGPALLFTDPRRYPNDEGLELGYNGYVQLAFRGAVLAINYRDLHGDTVYEERWEIRGGELAPPEGAGP